MSCYASAANDVWSLGVMLVNLTCGRNPWKRASLEDSTFRAYLKDPYFLQSILPLSTEMVYILSRVFERDPAKRITIPELRQLIVDCPRFTDSVMTTAPAPAQPSPVQVLQPQVQVPTAWDRLQGPIPYSQVPFTMPVDLDHQQLPMHAQPSGSSSDSSHYSDFSESAVSDTSALTEDYSDYSDYNCMSPVSSEQVQVPDCKVVFPHPICVEHPVPVDVFAAGAPIQVC
jgi:serine/threonine protein kinase